MDDATPISPTNSADSSEATDPSSDALARLRNRIRQAVQEIERLRTENRRLQARVRELEQRPALDDDEAFVRLKEDPEALRNQIEHFIETIDTYLDNSSNRSDK